MDKKYLLLSFSLGTLLLSGSTAFAKCAVMFVPGAFAAHSTGSSLFLKPQDYFRNYIDAAEGWGCATKMAELPVDATIEEQGMILKEEIIRFAKEQSTRLILIGHSQGALDAVYVVHDFRLDPFVKSVISIAAPFRGTPLADWVMTQRTSKSLYYYFLKFFASYDLATLSFVPELTPQFMTEHADHFARNENVRYAYARGLCVRNCHLSLRFASSLVDMDSSDGLIPANSQRAPYGDALGDYDIDHISEVSADRRGEIERQRLIDAIHGFIAPDLSNSK